MTVSLIIVIILVLGLCLGSLLIYIALLSRHRKSVGGTFNLLGMIASVHTRLEPEGTIILNGELWRARARHSMSPIVRGNEVRIVGATGHFLLVEPAD